MNSLITGGAGFIGSHVAQQCLDLGHDVVVIDDLSEGFIENIPANAHFIQGSITDKELIFKIFEKYRFNYIYHLAAYASVGLSHYIRRLNYITNIIGSINLIEASILNKVDCFVFTSSTAVYGSNQVPYNESMIPKPDDPYGISKLAIEYDLMAAHSMFDLNYIIFRPHNVYGEHQNIWDPFRNVVGVFIHQMINNQPLMIFGDGTQQRAFSYIADIAPYIAKCVNIPEAYNDIYNIGDDLPISLIELIDHISKIIKTEPRIDYLPSITKQQHAYANHSKAKEIFNIQSTTSLEKGLTNMVSWVRNAGNINYRKHYDIEIMTNIPSYWEKYISDQAS